MNIRTSSIYCAIWSRFCIRYLNIICFVIYTFCVRWRKSCRWQYSYASIVKPCGVWKVKNALIRHVVHQVFSRFVSCEQEFIHSFVLRQVHSLFQHVFSIECDLMLLTSSSFPFRHFCSAFPGISDPLAEMSKFQQHKMICSRCSN